MTIPELLQMALETGGVLVVVAMFLKTNRDSTRDFADKLEAISVECHSRQKELQDGYCEALERVCASHERTVDRIERRLDVAFSTMIAKGGGASGAPPQSDG